MPTISLTLPSAGQQITAGLHATNYAALQALINGGLDATNLAADSVGASELATGYDTKITHSAMSGGPPGSPSTGDIWIATAAGANGENWVFRYNGSSGSAYKWEFIGGAPVIVANDASLAIGSMTNTGGWYHSAADLSLTMPRAGDYEFFGGASFFNSGAGTVDLAVGRLAGGSITIPVSSPGLRRQSYVTTAPDAISINGKATALAANDVIGLAFSGTGLSSFQWRSLGVRPIRIS